MCDAPGRTRWRHTFLLCTYFWAVSAKEGQDLSKPGEIHHVWFEEWPGSAAYICHRGVPEQPYRNLNLPTHLRKPTSLYGHALDLGTKFMEHATHHLHRTVDPGTAQLEALIYNRPMITQEDLLRNAVANFGDPSRIQALFRKLLRGEPITMVALGGSITCGSITHDVPSYIEQVFQWINATFPHVDNTFINSCKGGAGSTEAGLCFDAKVPRNADLITMEFTLNDAYHHVPFAVEYGVQNPTAWTRDMHSDRRVGFEVLLRHALMHPNEPAVVYIHEWVAPFEGFSWWMSQEADMSAFLQYYRIPELSMRRALYRDTMEGTVGFKPEETVCDMMHPNDLGHRYYADVMVAFLQDHAWAAATGPPTGATTGPPVPLPAPLIPNNYEHGQQCAIDMALVTLVQPSQGWEWVDEGKLGHHKRGWRSTTPGSKLLFKPMDTTSKVQPIDEPVLLILGFLKSYEHMGQAVLACESGCTCKPLEIDSHHTTKESVTKQVYHLVSQSPTCVVSVTVLNTTSSGEHKIRIDMLGISTAGNATIWVRDHGPRPSASRKFRKLQQS